MTGAGDEPTLIGIWDRLMTYQVEFIMPLELPFYYNFEPWSQACSVIDFGTGNGCYLFRLAKLFAAKRYLGIDNCAAYIEMARSRYLELTTEPLLHLAFEVKDVFDPVGDRAERFDFAIARVLIQHLSDVGRFLDNAYQYLMPGGHLLVVEACDPERKFVPPVPAIMHLFEEVREATRAKGTDRDAGAKLETSAEAHGFSLRATHSLVVPSTFPGQKTVMFQSYSTILDLVRLHYGVDYDYNETRRQLQQWFEDPTSYTQVGVHMACYRRS